MNNICIFEDAGYLNLYPLTFGRPSFDLRLGNTTLISKIFRYFGHSNISLHCRDYLKSVLKQKYSDIPINNINSGSPCLFINGRVFMTQELATLLLSTDLAHDHLYTKNGEIVAVYVRHDQLESMKRILKSIPTGNEIFQQVRPGCVAIECENVSILNHLWDLVQLNQTAIKDDFMYENQPGIIKGEIHPFAALYNENNIFIDKNTIIEDFVVINAQNGPIYIESDVYIESHTRIDGPSFIGQGTKLLGGKIRKSSIGPYCKVCGEVSNSVFYAYSNKAHAGFIGDSYIGEWVNLGAHTTNSNLKNTYGSVQLEFENQKIDSQQAFLGSFMGDYVKTGIGTLLNTGTIIGYASALWGSTLHQKYIPPFTWGEAGHYEEYLLSKFIATAKKVKARRDQELTEAEKEVMLKLFEHHRVGQ